jgi:hypothetical protein
MNTVIKKNPRNKTEVQPKIHNGNPDSFHHLKKSVVPVHPNYSIWVVPVHTKASPRPFSEAHSKMKGGRKTTAGVLEGFAPGGFASLSTCSPTRVFDPRLLALGGGGRRTLLTDTKNNGSG